MNIEEDLTSLKEIVATRKERCHGFIESDSCFISTKRLETLLTAYEKEKEKNKELKEGYKIQEHNYQVAMEEIEQRWKDKIIAKVIEIKDRPVKDEFITATQGRLNTVIDIESLLDEEE